MGIWVFGCDTIQWSVCDEGERQSNTHRFGVMYRSPSLIN